MQTVTHHDMHPDMQAVKPSFAAHVRALLAFASEVARNAVAEARWRRRQRSQPAERTYGAGIVT
jgi:hypothetical protein